MQTDQQIENEISAGSYTKARERLLGLLSTYPNRLDLRRRLGDVYWHLGETLMAGRYWYLVANKNESMEAACIEFAHSCQDDPAIILKRLKFRGEVHLLTELYAQKQLEALQQQAYKQRRSDQTCLTIGLWSLLAIVVVTLLLAIVGLATVVQWLI